MVIPKPKILSSNEFIEKLEKWDVENQDKRIGIPKYLFRGQENHKWSLQPSIFRENNFELVKRIAFEYGFIQEHEWATISPENLNLLNAVFWVLFEAHDKFPKKLIEGDNTSLRDKLIPDHLTNSALNNIKFDMMRPITFMNEPHLIDLYGLAQHWGIPTTLLDWTTNPFKASYFSVRKPSDGVPILYRIRAENIFPGASDYKVIKVAKSGNPNLFFQEGHFIIKTNYCREGFFYNVGNKFDIEYILLDPKNSQSIKNYLKEKYNINEENLFPENNILYKEVQKILDEFKSMF